MSDETEKVYKKLEKVTKLLSMNSTSYFSMVWLSILRSLPLGRLSIIIPKTSTIWLKIPQAP
jgi:hypothetical protein